jgi:hypothetical protein
MCQPEVLQVAVKVMLLNQMTKRRTARRGNVRRNVSSNPNYFQPSKATSTGGITIGTEKTYRMMLIVAVFPLYRFTKVFGGTAVKIGIQAYVWTAEYTHTLNVGLLRHVKLTRFVFVCGEIFYISFSTIVWYPCVMPIRNFVFTFEKYSNCNIGAMDKNNNQPEKQTDNKTDNDSNQPINRMVRSNSEQLRCTTIRYYAQRLQPCYQTILVVVFVADVTNSHPWSW